ncbi:hypothetical protein MASR1M107_22570 [Ignavibacteriales bacterium]
MRFDDITRVEKYFSATVLPNLLYHNNFEGLKFFLQLLNSKLILPSVEKIDVSDFEEKMQSIQLLTEVYLERDLSYYKIKIAPESFRRKPSKTSIPDLLIIYNDWVILIEAKCFLSASSRSLYEQMQQQSYILDIIQNTILGTNLRTLQVCISPYNENLREFISLSWQEVYNKFTELIPEGHYFLNRLKSAVDRI